MVVYQSSHSRRIKRLMKQRGNNTFAPSLLHTSLESLTSVLGRIEKHEFVRLHKNRLRIFLYQIFLGISFAIGTVCGLLLLSWFSYLFLKDSQTVQAIVNGQLQARHFDLQDMQSKIKESVHTELQKIPLLVPQTKTQNKTREKVLSGTENTGEIQN